MDDLKGRVGCGIADKGGNGGGGGWIGDDEDRWACSAEGHAEDGRIGGEGEEFGQEGAGFHAVGLVDAVLHGGAEEIAAVEGEG